jgi:hypothetical protein
VTPGGELFALGRDSVAVMMTFRINEQFAAGLDPRAQIGSSSFGASCSGKAERASTERFPNALCSELQLV